MSTVGALEAVPSGTLNAQRAGWLPGTINPTQIARLKAMLEDGKFSRLEFTVPGEYILDNEDPFPEYPFWSNSEAGIQIGDIRQSTTGGTGPNFDTAGEDFFISTSAGTTSGNDSDLAGGSDSGVSWDIHKHSTNGALRVLLVEDLDVVCSGGVRFTAATRTEGTLISFGPNADGIRFSWTGGRISSENLLVGAINIKQYYPSWGGPGGPRGEDGNGTIAIADALSLRHSIGNDNSNTDAYFSDAYFDNISLFAGQHWQYAGGDSAIFTNCAISVHVDKVVCQGYNNAAIYLNAVEITANAMVDAVGPIGATHGRNMWKVSNSEFINCDKGAAIKEGFASAEMYSNKCWNCRTGIDIGGGNPSIWSTQHAHIHDNWAELTNKPLSLTTSTTWIIEDNTAERLGMTEVGGKHPADSTAANPQPTSDGATNLWGIYIASGTGVARNNYILNVSPTWINWSQSGDGGFGTGPEGSRGIFASQSASGQPMGASTFSRNHLFGMERPYVEFNGEGHQPDHLYEGNFIENCQRQPQSSVYHHGSLSGTSRDLDLERRSAWHRAISVVATTYVSVGNLDEAQNTGPGSSPAFLAKDNRTSAGQTQSPYEPRFAMADGAQKSVAASIPTDVGWEDMPGEVYGMEIDWSCIGNGTDALVDTLLGFQLSPFDDRGARNPAVGFEIHNASSFTMDGVDDIHTIQRWEFTTPVPVSHGDHINVMVAREGQTDAFTLAIGLSAIRVLWRPIAAWVEPT